jgi:hypothetical protein
MLSVSKRLGQEQFPRSVHLQQGDMGAGTLSQACLQTVQFLLNSMVAQLRLEICGPPDLTAKAGE